jgi:hypothetical protein
MQQESNYQQLISKLDQFTRKYYLNKLIKGSLYTIGIVLGLFLVFSVLEHNFYFSKGVRKLFFLSFMGVSLATLGYFVILPLTRFFKLGKVISHEYAAQIIGAHFSDVKDQLLNVLQLKKQSDQDGSDLLFASIEQKTDKIRLVPFKTAIDLSSNKKYLRYALPPFLILVGILFMAPSIIKDSSYRIINNNKEFERAAPFQFNWQGSNLEVVQYEDFELQVEADGAVLPDEAFIEIDDFQYRMQKEGNGKFSYVFRNVQKDLEFRVFSGRVSSPSEELKVLTKPNLTDLNIALDFPSYTQRKDETLSNRGDLVIPEGTKIKWTFDALYTDDVHMKFSLEDERVVTEKKSPSVYTYSKTVKEDDLYKVFISNERIPTPDSISYGINVVKDEYPSISVEQFVDSVENDVLYFLGTASDDYGLNNLSFNYTISSQKGAVKKQESIKVVDPRGRETQYDYTFDVSTLNLAPGDQVTYYFKVFDNDGVNGRKSAKTGVLQFKKPTLEEYKEQEDANEEEIKDNLKEARDDLRKMQDNFRKMREKLLQEKELDWQDKEELQKLLEEQKKLQEKLEKAKEKFEENLKNQEEFSEQKEEILEKQEKLQELFEEALNPEKQELMEKIQELMQELNKDEAMEMMEEMEMNDEQMEQEMDRLLELYKNLEVEKEMKDQIEKLEELAEKQEELAKENEKNEKPSEENKEKQEELNKEFEELQEEMKETQKKNEELERPKETPSDTEEQMEDIQEDMQDSQEKMEQEDSQGASKKQKSAAKKMQQMASSMAGAMEGGEQEQNEEDIKAIRQLLENLVDMSFDQEDLIGNFARTKTTTPKYVELIQEQFKLKEDFVMIEDSLVALAKRNDKIESYVLDKVSEIKVNLKEGVDLLEERSTNEASANQRITMTNVNDLALMLNESMENMQQSMASSMPGSQMCNKPGGKGQGKSGKIPQDKISDGQQGMGEELQKMMQNAKDGKGNSSKDFAKAAARQAALRKALQDMAKEKSEQGKGTKELQEIIDQMNKIEEDLVNKRLDNEMLKRQQEIKTRLLEAEEAERQREKDNKRKAEVGQDKNRELPPSLKAYLKEREAEIEMYKTISPSLKPYYKYLVDEYYKALKEK